MRTGAALVVLVAAALAAGCRSDMQNQPKYKPLGRNDFFSDHRDSRPPVADTVARGTVDPDTTVMTGRKAGQPVATAPVPATAATLARGRERYDIYCAPCHDRVGTGNGMIVQRGFKQPPSFHTDRLRAAPDGHFFEAISKGFGVMPSYGQQVPIADRWAITLYVRALQLSRWATLADVPPAERPALAEER